MRIRSKIRTGVAALGMAVAGVALAAGPAAAGSNGNQIRFYDNDGTVYSVWVSGYNQNGQWVSNCFGTPHSTTNLDGWWWSGYVHIDAYHNSSCSGSWPDAGSNNVWINPDLPTDYHNVFYTNGKITG
ncbi:hypothetical protein [Streptomyces palmae]|uniref:Secreted protein n=1 Tax=Streptomyces palmae TaxID=1701085 RepID=A0A4Z0HE05_9ACTN|nr:hypothetical protein [Streptomyces palmae]TGB13743.1 hypothetical protein E4099_09580 [Streptomyces palmae]